MAKHKRAVLTLVVLVFLVLGSLTLATNGFGESSTGSLNSGQLLAAAARDEVAALAVPAASSDALPDAVANGPLLADGIVDAGSSRLVRTVGRGTWLAASADGKSVCQVTPGALACSPVEEIAAKGLGPALVQRQGEPIHVSGVTGNSVRKVEVVLSDGTVRMVDVSRNFFEIDTAVIPKQLRWTGPSGPETFDFPQH